MWHSPGGTLNSLRFSCFSCLNKCYCSEVNVWLSMTNSSDTSPLNPWSVQEFQGWTLEVVNIELLNGDFPFGRAQITWQVLFSYLRTRGKQFQFPTLFSFGKNKSLSIEAYQKAASIYKELDFCAHIKLHTSFVLNTHDILESTWCPIIW